MEKWIAAKDRMNGNRWGVFCPTSRCFNFIGKGKRFCEKKAKELNELTNRKSLADS